ncbi:putative protocadherin beta-18 isoform X3 [Octopus sinensis]|uniref:Protocadherin beta-18 isoform X3 n=2 Tax=Octopus sinensis TaxID=2607531 RepID=A0A6P7T2C1_9MOLL|nr:putative protocadherin beta-18 isoform X3 [Octopus sinensis]
MDYLYYRKKAPFSFTEDLPSLTNFLVMKRIKRQDVLHTAAILSLVLHCCLCVDLTYHVEEGKGPGAYVGDIATDLHLMDKIPFQDHNLITFSQLEQRLSDSFRLFNVTKKGKLHTAQSLDAESLCSYKMECSKIVKVAVRKAETFMKVLKIKVVIQDVNDNRPEFPEKFANIQFSEGDKEGMLKAIPNAIDRDVGVRNSKITYQLETKDKAPFMLSVKKRITGSSKLGIVLTKSLDRETKDSYNLQVIAKDGGYPPNQGLLNIHVSIVDDNDNFPIFSKDIYNVSIRNALQRDKPIITLSAKDLDSGENGRVTYHFSSETSAYTKSHFWLNNVTGEIFIAKNLSSERKKNYKLLIEARDGSSSPLSSTAIVLVNVINQHNNPPVIDVNFVTELRENTATISEGIKVGSFIAYVSVIDNDVGQNGEVECSLHHDKFLLLDLGSKEYKITLKKPVDREKQDRYDITISCEDKGSPPLQTQRQFSIEVMDVNDVQPQFTKESFKFLTYENGKTNFPIGFINATDPDLGAGGQLTFSLLSTSKHVIPFQITDYGFISTTIPLDREQQNVYKFQVFVKDNGNPSLNNTANVIVEVLDENDNAPYFTFPSMDPFRFDVSYHPQSKKEITVLRASDRDSHLNAFLRYEIIGGNNKQLFSINPYSGVLSYARTVYQNDAGTYRLEFLVKDSGTPALTATTTIILTLSVSNKTSVSNNFQPSSDNMINLTWFIIIVAIAVILSVILVVSITLCFVRCNNDRHGSPRAGVSTAIPSDREKSHYITQTKKPVPTSGHSAEVSRRNTQVIESKAEFYPQYESQSEWITSTTERRPPSVLLLPTRIPKR